jgi:hypothetical protein
MTLPTVTLVILARDMAYCLPEFLECVRRQSYPKNLITLQVRTNDSSDSTELVLREWLERVGPEYARVNFDASPLGSGDAGHTWTDANLSRIIRVREESLARFRAASTDYFFLVDCDNFLTEPSTLLDLVRVGKPIVAPMLEPLPHEGSYYRNYFSEIDKNGYYEESPLYLPILSRLVRGAIHVPVVHCTYLVERVAMERGLTYVGAAVYDFVNFAASARSADVDQVILNEKPYGFLLHGMAEGDYEAKCRPRVLEAMGRQTPLEVPGKGKEARVDPYSDSIDGQFTFKQFYRWLVNDLANRTREPHVVEVGAYKGASAAFLAVELANEFEAPKLDLVDLWTEDPLFFECAKNLVPVKSVIGAMHRTFSHVASRLYADASLDAVFIDAGHSYEDVSRDIDTWLPKVKKGGVLAGHDHNAKHFEGVIRAVTERFERYEVFRGERFPADNDYYPVWMVRVP